MQTEAFEFYSPVKMKDDPRWIDVTALFVNGPAATSKDLFGHPDTGEHFFTYLDRLQNLRNILDRDFYVDGITGADKTVDVVVDIFNRVDSGGTKLSKGDLASARICSDAGVRFTPDWLMRNVNAVATGRAPFPALEDVSASDFQDALFKTLHNVDHLADLFASRLGLDHDRVLFGRAVIPVLSRLLHTRGGRFADRAEADRALCWSVHAAVRGRYAVSGETTPNKQGQPDDRREGRRGRQPRLPVLPAALPRHPHRRRSRPGHRPAAGLRHRCRRGARDLSPRPGDQGAEVNSVANYAFVTPSTATALHGREPGEYLPTLTADARASQWIPDGPWRLDAYPGFLAARRKLLAAAANGFLGELMSGTLPATRELTPDARAAQVAALVEELAGLGYARPLCDEEVTDAETGRVLAVAGAFWPECGATGSPTRVPPPTRPAPRSGPGRDGTGPDGRTAGRPRPARCPGTRPGTAGHAATSTLSPASCSSVSWSAGSSAHG